MCPVCFLLVFLFLSALSAMSLSIVYFGYDVNIKLEIRSVEHGICPIATSTINELFL